MRITLGFVGGWRCPRGGQAGFSGGAASLAFFALSSACAKLRYAGGGNHLPKSETRTQISQTEPTSIIVSGMAISILKAVIIIRE
jgi:hypothetical protein